MPDKYLSDIEIIENMKGKNILVVGDIMLDRFVYGNVERISPESPVPVLSVKRENIMLGGAGNTLANLVSLGCESKILSIIGDDKDGEQIKLLAQKQNVDVSGLIKSKNRQSIVKARFLAGHQQLLRTDYEIVEDISQDLIDVLLDKAKEILSNINIMIISDYGKGLLTPTLLKSLISLAKSNGVTILVDPKGCDYSIYSGADIVTPNKKELSLATAGMEVDSDIQIIEAAQYLRKISGVKAVVATRSQDGMSVIQENKIKHIRSASDIEVFDVSGAGDCVIATFAAALAAGANLEKAAFLANIAGSIVVSKVGTTPVRAQELIEAVHDRNEVQIDRVRKSPILSWEEAREELQRWKARGLKVGFTNGCFDIIHFGHVTYLNDARLKCDRLVVGMNSDASVRVLKGEDRPIHDEISRAHVLAALGSVDMVVMFGASKAGEDNTANELLDILHPDVYFKGGDYTIDQIPEAPIVQKNGGKVKIMPVYDGHSSTNSISNIKKNSV